ncbi:MAG TPA: DUF6618 family protein [Clostridia bacterium]|nr:DUF6618 family protein [Clostridia bacterium]
MEYICHNPSARKKYDQKWKAELNNIRIGTNYSEMDVIGRGSSFHVIFGRYINGNYLCIPEWNVGCDLASLTDTFWNTEKIENQIGKVDAITVASALKEAYLLIEKAVV